MKRQDFSRKIIKILMDKPAISFPEIVERMNTQDGSKPALPAGRYAINRSMRGLAEAGLIEHITSAQSQYARLTKEGKKKGHSIKLEGDNAVINTSWDGYWRLILLDLPEERKSEREALRYLLKKAGFICVKNSVWISMYPYEHLFTNIKKDLDLTTEMVIIVTDKIDETSEQIFLENLKK